MGLLGAKHINDDDADRKDDDDHKDDDDDYDDQNDHGEPTTRRTTLRKIAS